MGEGRGGGGGQRNLSLKDDLQWHKFQSRFYEEPGRNCSGSQFLFLFFFYIHMFKLTLNAERGEGDSVEEGAKLL